MAEPDGERRRAEIEAWWALVTRILSFIAGLMLVCYEALFGIGDDPKVRALLILSGIAMMGPVIAASVASMLAAMRGDRDRG